MKKSKNFETTMNYIYLLYNNSFEDILINYLKYKNDLNFQIVGDISNIGSSIFIDDLDHDFKNLSGLVK